MKVKGQQSKTWSFDTAAARKLEAEFQLDYAFDTVGDSLIEVVWSADKAVRKSTGGAHSTCRDELLSCVDHHLDDLELDNDRLYLTLVCKQPATDHCVLNYAKPFIQIFDLADPKAVTRLDPVCDWLGDAKSGDWASLQQCSQTKADTIFANLRAAAIELCQVATWRAVWKTYTTTFAQRATTAAASAEKQFGVKLGASTKAAVAGLPAAMSVGMVGALVFLLLARWLLLTTGWFGLCRVVRCCCCRGSPADEGEWDGDYGPDGNLAQSPAVKASYGAGEEYSRAGRDLAEREIAKLVQTPEFRKWEAARHNSS